ncbi:MAG: endonuclease III domain-containing protein [Candidatus Sericytochromatia bacterium]
MSEFPVSDALQRVREAIRPYPRAAMFELFERGFTSLYAQLVGCLLSIRTRDEVAQPAALALLTRAPDPASLQALPESELLELIAATTFPGQKAAWLKGLAQQIVTQHGGEMPCEREAVLALPGIGPKCAHLALGIACGQARISVDIHVHRITKRWGYVATRTPEQTLAALEQKLPRAYWVEINALLVPFGKHICTGSAPHCSTCPLREICPQIGVTRSR